MDFTWRALRACRAAVVSFILVLPLDAIAASTISVIPGGSGAFSLQGAGLADVSIIDLAISYDESSLTNPRVAAGPITAGAMTAANISQAGIVRLSVIAARPITGNGTIATLTFDSTSDSGWITGLSGSIIGTNGKPLPLAFSGTRPASMTPAADRTGAQPAGTAADTQQNADQPPAIHPVITGGSLAVEGTEAGKEEKKEIEPSGATSAETTEPAISGDGEPLSGKAKEDASPLQEENPFERFQVFQGKRSIESLTGLFAATKRPFRQEPAVAISDGETTVKIMIPGLPADKEPSITTGGATIVSVTKSDGLWIVEAKPDRGALTATVTIPVGGAFPLVVTPPADVDLDHSGRVTEADFRMFLQERGTDDSPTFDLNGDGKRDFIDDYIFTANYLAKKEASPGTSTQRAPAEKPAEKPASNLPATNSPQ